MQFLNSLFADNRLVTLGAAVAAFLVFAVLILVLVRLLFGNRLRTSGGRGRQQRLGVVDAYDMDRQRQLVLVRRDNTEHLIMIGGPNDVLIESSIIRAEARDGRERAASLRDGSAGESASRLPLPDAWPASAETEETAGGSPSSGRPAVVDQPPLISAGSNAFAPAEDASVDYAPSVPSAPQPAEPATPPPEPVRPPILMRLRGRGETPRAQEPTPEPVQKPAREPASAISSAPVVEPVVSQPPAASAPEPEAPPILPPVPTPPLAEADFFETEIAKALAPSLRSKPAGLPPQGTPAPSAGAAGQAVPRPPIPPRAPLRPFPLRRDPVTPQPLPAPPSASEGGGTVEARPSRPPPPPFFSRMAQRAKEAEEARNEPSLTASPVPAASSPKADAVAEQGPASRMPSHEPAPVTETFAPPSHETTPLPHAAPLEPARTAPDPQPSTPSSEAVDSFEEEMARLLGRAGSKDQ